MPQLLLTLLTLGGVDVEEVQAEDEKLLEEAHHLGFVERDEATLGAGLERMGEALMIAEDGLGLQQVRSRQLFDDAIGTVVGKGFHLQRTRKEEEELRTRVVGSYDRLSCRQLMEAELRVARHLSKIVAAHALKQGELQELVVELKKWHSGVSRLSCFSTMARTTRRWCRRAWRR